jgi:hypothetical protein
METERDCERHNPQSAYPKDKIAMPVPEIAVRTHVSWAAFRYFKGQVRFSGPSTTDRLAPSYQEVISIT